MQPKSEPKEWGKGDATLLFIDEGIRKRVASPFSFPLFRDRHGFRPPRPAPISQQLLYWHERRSALVLDQEHQEFRRLGRACVPVNEMNIVGAFIEALSRCQCYLFSALHLHHDRALQHVDERMCIVSVDSARLAGRMLYRYHQNFLA